jgi:hypothetical protein
MTQPASIVEAFAPLLPRVAEHEIPMLIAMIERLAARRYLGWAAASEDAIERAGLLACAQREDEIAEFIESLETDAPARIAELDARFPDLNDRYESVMAGRSRAEQLRVQAEGELGGAGYMRQFAAAHRGAVAARFASLACCEEANSSYLSTLIARR